MVDYFCGLSYTQRLPETQGKIKMIQSDYPSVMSAMGLLTHLNSNELKELLNDDVKFESILKNVNQVKDAEKEMVIASNRSLAEFNLSKESELERMKVELQEKSELGEQLCTRIQELLNDYKTKSAGISPDTTHALLQTAAAESEEQSDNIARDFLSGKMGVDKFLEDFEPLRKQMHIRKYKAEKMTELLRNNSNQNAYGNGANKPHLPYPSYVLSSNPTSLPYPEGPLNMPMPGMYGNHF